MCLLLWQVMVYGIWSGIVAICLAKFSAVQVQNLVTLKNISSFPQANWPVGQKLK